MTITYREYHSYDDYLKHQSKKLDRLLKKRNKASHKVRKEYFKSEVNRHYRRLKKVVKFVKNGRILCLGARTGAEIVAFNKHGFKRVDGIDINPGKNNKYVKKGDFHKTGYEDNAFDTLYCNCIDHVWNIEKFYNEMFRILKGEGICILEIEHSLNYYKDNTIEFVRQSEHTRYESVVFDNFDDIKEIFKEFELVHESVSKEVFINAVFKSNKEIK
jgi:SAM-dependent methyltransferase